MLSRTTDPANVERIRLRDSASPSISAGPLTDPLPFFVRFFFKGKFVQNHILLVSVNHKSLIFNHFKQKQPPYSLLHYKWVIRLLILMETIVE